MLFVFHWSSATKKKNKCISITYMYKFIDLVSFQLLPLSLLVLFGFMWRVTLNIFHLSVCLCASMRGIPFLRVRLYMLYSIYRTHDDFLMGIGLEIESSEWDQTNASQTKSQLTTKKQRFCLTYIYILFHYTSQCMCSRVFRSHFFYRIRFWAIYDKFGCVVWATIVILILSGTQS